MFNISLDTYDKLIPLSNVHNETQVSQLIITQMIQIIGLFNNFSQINCIKIYSEIVKEIGSRMCLKCDGTRAETRLRLSAKRTSPFKPAGASVQSTTGSRGVRISGSNGSNAAYIMF